LKRLEWGSVSNRILAHLAAGPATTTQLTAALGVDRLTVKTAVARLCEPELRKGGARRVYVVAYTYDDDLGGRTYPRPLYALGDEPDALKPDRKTRAETSAEHRQRQRQRLAEAIKRKKGNPNSVFEYAQQFKSTNRSRKCPSPSSSRSSR
jgi:hypothetical protein